MTTFGDEWRRGRHSDHDAARGLTHTVCVYILATFPGCSPQWRRETRISGLPAWVCADFGAPRPWVPNSVDLGCLLPNTPISGLPPESAPTLDSFPFLIELKSCILVHNDQESDWPLFVRHFDRTCDRIANGLEARRQRTGRLGCGCCWYCWPRSGRCL